MQTMTVKNNLANVNTHIFLKLNNVWLHARSSYIWVNTLPLHHNPINFSLLTFFNLPIYTKWGPQNSTNGLPHTAQHVVLRHCMNLHPTPVHNYSKQTIPSPITVSTDYSIYLLLYFKLL